MEIILDEYGCNVNKFTSIDNLKLLINKFWITIIDIIFEIVLRFKNNEVDKGFNG